MSEEEFESYLRLMGRFLKLSAPQRESIKTELRDHMEERLTELMDEGHSREEAIDVALDEFGDAAAIALDFRKIGRRRKWIMRTATSTVGIAATVLIVSFLLPENRPSVPAPGYTQAQDSPAQKSPAKDVLASKTSPAATPKEADVPSVLEKVLPELAFEETPLQEAISYLQDQTGLNVYVNWDAIEQAGVERDAPIELNLKNVPFQQGLDFVLLEAGNGEMLLSYAMEGNVLVISSKDALGEETKVQIYDCRDLINGLASGVTQEQARGPHRESNFARHAFAVPPQPQVFAAYVVAKLPHEQRSALDPYARPKTSAPSCRLAPQLVAVQGQDPVTVAAAAPQTAPPRGRRGQEKFRGCLFSCESTCNTGTAPSIAHNHNRKSQQVLPPPSDDCAQSELACVPHCRTPEPSHRIRQHDHQHDRI